MQFLKGKEEEVALEHIMTAATVARSATCQRSKCGSIVVWRDEVIGIGFNSPPGDLESQRRCQVEKDSYHRKVTDKTCCVHAEERAIMDALRRHPEKLKDSWLYFVRLDQNDLPSRAGAPYCTLCSKMSLDAGISKFVLWHEKGICAYDTAEYNSLSYKFQG